MRLVFEQINVAGTDNHRIGEIWDYKEITSLTVVVCVADASLLIHRMILLVPARALYTPTVRTGGGSMRTLGDS